MGLRGYRVSGLRVQGLGRRLRGLGLKVHGLGFRAQSYWVTGTSSAQWPLDFFVSSLIGSAILGFLASVATTTTKRQTYSLPAGPACKHPSCNMGDFQHDASCLGK